MKIKREYHPFMLDPALKENSYVFILFYQSTINVSNFVIIRVALPIRRARDKRTHYEKKFGKDRMKEMEPAMKARGKEVGIDL